MNKTHTFLLAGFGGQGILFTGKVIAYAGMIDEKEVSWLPSYGPEMRGGTANCSVTISDKPIGSPLVINPACLMVLNQPSFDKFEPLAARGCKMIVDSSLIASKSSRYDIEAFYIPATSLANENDLKGLSNMIMLGKMFKEYPFCDRETLLKALKKSIPPKKAELYELNVKAIDIGYNY